MNLKTKYDSIVRSRNYLGCGTKAVTFELNDEYVLRWSPDPTDGFHVLWDLSDEVLDRLGMVRFNRRLSLPEHNYYVVERPIRSPYSSWIGTDKCHMIMNDLWRVKHLKGFILHKHLYKEHPLYWPSRNIYKAYRYMKRFKDPVIMDINPSNLMIRETGEYIWSDPFLAKVK